MTMKQWVALGELIGIAILALAIVYHFGSPKTNLGGFYADAIVLMVTFGIWQSIILLRNK